LFVLLELTFEKLEQMKALTAEEPKRGPGRPKKQETTTATTSAGPAQVIVS